MDVIAIVMRLLYRLMMIEGYIFGCAELLTNELFLEAQDEDPQRTKFALASSEVDKSSFLVNRLSHHRASIVPLYFS